MSGAARRGEPPPFTAPGEDQPLRVVTAESGSTIDGGIPRGVRVAAAWSWRLILFVLTAYVLLKLISLLRVVLIPVAIALLLAALFQPFAAWLNRHGVQRSLAAGLVLVGSLLLVFGAVALIAQTVIGQVSGLSTQVRQGLDEVRVWLARGPLHISQAHLTNAIDSLQKRIGASQGALTSGALNTATTVGELATGFLLVLFTLFFFLRDGATIWRFLCRLLPRPARVPVARAGHYAWFTLVSYVRATVLVAFVDALGVGIGLALLRIPLALPMAALVFLGAFIPVIGAILSGALAVLIALVTHGPVSALAVIGLLIAVGQLEGHVLQPLIMGRAVALHPLAVVLAIATGVVVAGIVGGLVAVPLLAVFNTAVRYLVEHPGGEPTPDRKPPGTRASKKDEARAEERTERAEERAGPTDPPPESSSVGERRNWLTG